MTAYIIRRLLLMIPTLLGIMLLNFIIVQAAPGGPVERLIAQIQGHDMDATARIAGGSAGGDSGRGNGGGKNMPLAQHGESSASKYRGAQGLDPDLIADIEKLYGFDQPASTRFLKMLGQYARFDFGTSFYSDRRVIDLIADKLPVSISLGVWTTLLVYLISIPLGIRKAVRDGTPFDVATSVAITVGYAIPNFLFAVLLVILFAGGSFLSWFPLRGLTSEDFDTLSTGAQIVDYFWHMALPTLALVISGFAGLTMLTKNSFLEELHKHYVLTARAKGVSEKRVLYRHIFRNAMLIVIAGFPAAFISILFTSALLIEVIFSLDGLGLLGFEAAVNRDYPVMFGTLYIFTLIGLVTNLIGDLMYVMIDPRIDFNRREG